MLKRKGLVIHPWELDETWLTLLTEIGANTLGLHPVGGRNADASLESLLQSREQLKPLLEKARDRGLQVEYEMHALSWMIPRSLFATHPDWFRMNEARERVPDFHLCASNPEALEELSSRAELLARLLPSDTHCYHLWTDDVTGYRCNCPQCSAMSASDQQLLLVNAILRGIRQSDPQGRIAYLAYLDALQIPEHVQPEKGVFLEYAPFRRDVHHALDDESCEKNLREAAPLDALLRFFGSENAKALDYWTDNSMFSGWKYPPQPLRLDGEVMARDVRFYEQKGFTAVTAFACYLGPDYRKLYGTPDLSGCRTAYTAIGESLLS